MWERRRGALAGLVTALFGVALSSCGGSSPGCPLPTAGSPQGTLTIVEKHEFGRMYEVFEATYILDDCVFFQTRDTAELRKPELSTPPRAIEAGRHHFRYSYKLRADFQSNMNGWEWYASGGAELELPPGGAGRITVVMREEGQGDPRERLKIRPSFE